MTVLNEEHPYDVKAKILVVDDEPFNLEIMEEILCDTYDISYASSGSECLESLQISLPDVILLDINMPGMSGYEVCQEIKKKPSTKDIPVAFVSALDTLAERLAGYDVGGDDYITKPFEAKELLRRVNVAIQYRKEKESLRCNANRALSKANTALTMNHELSIILQFLRTSLTCDDIETLANAASHTLETLGVQGSVQIRAGENVTHKSSDGVVVPLEQSVVKKIHSEDAFIDLGHQAVINFEHVSILIKNRLPDDLIIFKRLRENIILLAESIESRVVALLTASALTKKQTLLANVADAVRSAFHKINDTFDMHNAQNKKTVVNYIDYMNGALAPLTLSASQRVVLQEILNKAAGVLAELDRCEVQIEAYLSMVMIDVQRMLDLDSHCRDNAKEV
ncbi:MAG: response regulator [Gammaproteobacteria bacterium]|nr:response regulator [Gammaproteobacteria bacterium]